MHIALLTNEYPPHIYGGAGVHVEYLVRELTALGDGAHSVDVYCFGDQRLERGRLRVHGVEPGTEVPANDPRHARFLETMVRDIRMAGLVSGADVVPLPHVVHPFGRLPGSPARRSAARVDDPFSGTTPSLEGGTAGDGYQASSWIEETAYRQADGVVAVSESMKRDVMALYGVPQERIRVIPNGIDPDAYRPVDRPDVLERHGVDPSRPFVFFVGRITRQKGIIHLVEAIRHFREGTQVVLCAGAPDTEEIAAEMEATVAAVRSIGRHDVVWITAMLPREELVSLYAAAAVFVCPSIYEPFGIINLEAMACETAVVASAVGGIPGIVKDGETGLLVPFETAPDRFDPVDPEAFARGLAGAVNRLMEEEDERRTMGRHGRRRVLERFSWRSVAERTLRFYESLLRGQ